MIALIARLSRLSDANDHGKGDNALGAISFALIWVIIGAVALVNLTVGVLVARWFPGGWWIFVPTVTLTCVVVDGVRWIATHEPETKDTRDMEDAR